MGVLLLSRREGLSTELDAFWLSLPLASLLGQVPPAVAWAVFIPAASDVIARGDRQRAWSLLATLSVMLVCAVSVIGAALWLWTPLLLGVLGPGLSGAGHAQGTDVMRVLLLYGAATAVAGGFSAGLNAHRVFFIPALCTSLSNCGGLVALALPPVGSSTIGYSTGLAAGAAVSMCAQLALFVAMRPRGAAIVILRDAAFAGVAQRSLGVLIVRIADYLPNLIVRGAASLLPVGSVSAIGLASNAIQPPTLVASAVTTVLFPSWASSTHRPEAGGSLAPVARANRLVFWVLGLMSVLCLAVCPLLALIVGGVDTRLLTLSFAAVVVGWPWIGTNFLVGSLFWARSLVRLRVALECVYIALVTLLAFAFLAAGAPGLLFSQSLGFLALLLVGWHALQRGRTEKQFFTAYTVQLSVLIVLIGVPLVLAALSAAEQSWAVWILCIASGLLAAGGGLAYVLISLALHLPEPRLAYRTLETQLFRR